MMMGRWGVSAELIRYPVRYVSKC